MTLNDVLQVLIYLGVLLVLTKPLGAYMARVYEGEPTVLDPVLGPLERFLYRAAGIRPDEGMSWKTYTLAMLVFNGLSLLVVYVVQRVQGLLPFNPQQFGAVSADSAFNTAASFATNTNWQGYGGETTMSYLTQMVALTVQNFVSARHCAHVTRYDTTTDYPGGSHGACNSPSRPPEPSTPPVRPTAPHSPSQNPRTGFLRTRG